MFKKGVSPLIATVLIIGFTIAVVGIAITWQQGLIQSIMEEPIIEVECSELDFEVSAACQLSDSIIITFENFGEEPIYGIEFRITGTLTSQMAPSPPFTTYPTAAGKTINLPYVASLIGGLEEVEVIPKVQIKDGATLCTDQAITLINLPSC